VNSLGVILVIFVISLCGNQSCRSFKQNALFVTDSSVNLNSFNNAYESATKNYVITNMDYIAISVFTDSGEVLIDPNNEFEGGGNNGLNIGGGAFGFNNGGFGGGGGINTGGNLPISTNQASPRNYLINGEGTVNLPMVGKIKLSGLTLSQADSLLAEEFSYYYEDPYVITQYLNKRVVLMGALGDRIIRLTEENITLVELLAIAGGFQATAQVKKVLIIRGRGPEASVQVVDLSTFESYRSANLDLMPNDIVYVEPRRKLDRNAIAEINTAISPLATIASAISGVTTIIFLIRELTRGN